MNTDIIGYFAVSNNGVIGNSNNPPWCLPWSSLPEDLPRFKQATLGHPIIMGRNTHEIFQRPLSGRINIVLSSNPAWKPSEGFIKCDSLDHAITRYKGGFEKIYIIGGAEIIRRALLENVMTKIIRTETYQNYDGDVFFPEWDQNNWTVINREEFPQYGYDIVHYTNKRLL